jgi:hypothetical protein
MGDVGGGLCWGTQTEIEMNVTPLQPNVTQAQESSRAQLDPMQDGAMMRRVKGDESVSSERAPEKTEGTRSQDPNLGRSVDTYA